MVVRHEFQPQVRFKLFVLLRPTCLSQMWSKRASAEVHLSVHLSHWQDRLSSALAVVVVAVVVVVVVAVTLAVGALGADASSC